MIYKTTDEIIKDVAIRFRKIRKIKKITQEELSKMSNVSYGTIKRFERCGEISLSSLVRLCSALDITEDIDSLFNKTVFSSLDEVIQYDKA